MNICVHGETLHAWVGAARLAETGNQVILRRAVMGGEALPPLKEPGLRDLVLDQQDALRLTLCSIDDLPDCDIHMAAMAGRYTDMKPLVTDILQHAAADRHLMVLSPYPVGSLDQLQQDCDQTAESLGISHRLHVVGLPQFIREGSALADFAHPWLLVASGTSIATALALELFRPFIRHHTHVMCVPHATAELIRMGINALLATRLSFINEMASLAEQLGVDIEPVRDGIGADPRIGRDYLEPGCGFGGPSFSDELIHYSQTIHQQLDTHGLIDAVIRINESQREILFRKLWRYFNGQMTGRRIAIWGAAFKPATASVENSVVHPLLKALWAQGSRTSVYDPMASQNLAAEYTHQPFLEICPSAMDAAQGADALVIVTAWDEFGNPDFEWLKTNLRRPVIFDGRNLYNPEYMAKAGFEYFAIGRGQAI
jgi:UDPglucose 6-dehydrogenase